MLDHPVEIISLKKPLSIPLDSACVEMKKACRATKRYSGSQELFARWPNLREASQRLTSLLTLYWPDPRNERKSLLVNCLDAGLAEAERSIVKDNNDMKEQKVFIQKVSSELVQCLEMTLMIKRSGVWTIYDPSIDGYLDEIMKSSVSEELSWVKQPHGAFKSAQSKLLCASRVFTMTELKLAGLLE
ncbi:MAG: hypothetical protein Q8K07_14575 [Methylicorpusculum sp.]|jgi:hypothetical protein|uniref:hypothetical protein n=1 Tax=Methylicorpusculum TaxID=2713642 RepID=UPI00135BF00C|nr:MULTISPECIES: hypothetical protein [Methylicorpusculum]MBS3951488.1 hypothetical protein [Methylomicrobium sp.]MCD2453662.1 hypothetical protein [Methylicorpusculum oleiharenae]MDO8845598.1 hypothetical protein [Methylicorpusculum sp.]MDO9240639.1 hypothetical protein [Methylicorpusculum sp.]MDP2180869.1 hypothetical protein [Methylicorpusculum sp.]